jgi:hypothetical protein
LERRHNGRQRLIREIIGEVFAAESAPTENKKAAIARGLLRRCIGSY